MKEALEELLPPGGALRGRLFTRLIEAPKDDDELAKGTRIGPWRIGEVLGRGGSSTVYLAERCDGQFAQQAALKVVRANEALTVHFRRERQILAELRHPSIAQLIDGGQMPGGRLWFAMEPVFGERIDRYVRSRRLPLAERIRLLGAICEAVGYAHSRLLIHRDIKPANLLVDERGDPRLLDFGIASASNSHEVDTYHAMTLTYASPEQREGGAITTASDIFQLGLLLQSLLMPAGEPCETLPKPMRARLRTEIAAVIARAMEHECAARYPTVASMRADLQALLERKPVSVIGGSRYRLARFLERHAMSSAIAAIGCVALLSTAWIAADRVRIERDQAQAAAARERATSEFLVGLFSVSDPAENRGETLTANQILTRGATQLRRRIGTNPAQTAAVAVEIGRVYLELGEFRHARETLSAELDDADAALPRDATERLSLHALRGRAAYFLSDYAAAGEDFAAARRLLAFSEDGSQRNAEDGALASQEAQLARRLGKIDEAFETQRRAIELLQASRPGDDPLLGLAWNNMGIIERERGNYTDSERAFERAIDIYTTHYGEGHPRALDPMGNLAEVLCVYKNETERAETLLLDVIASRRALHEETSLKLATNLDMLAQVRLDQGRNEEAATLAREADAGFANALGPEHNYRAFALVHMGHALLALREDAGALGAFREALRLRRLAFGPEHPDVANSLDNLGEASLRLGHTSEAEASFHEALAIRERVLPVGHVEVPQTRIRWAETLIALGRGEDARREIARALDELERSSEAAQSDRQRAAELMAQLVRGGI
ncbi:MAG: tetratricopeptide repeat protein [Rhodanobacteraceae bacterium]